MQNKVEFQSPIKKNHLLQISVKLRPQLTLLVHNLMHAFLHQTLSGSEISFSCMKAAGGWTWDAKSKWEDRRRRAQSEKASGNFFLLFLFLRLHVDMEALVGCWVPSWTGSVYSYMSEIFWQQCKKNGRIYVDIKLFALLFFFAQ